MVIILANHSHLVVNIQYNIQLLVEIIFSMFTENKQILYL